ncbi:MAG: nuclear transport factor 2 family protein [Acidobacteriota bacterium]
MKQTISLLLLAAAAGLASACGAPADNKPANAANSVNTTNKTNSNASNSAAKTAAAPASKDALLAIEKQGWEAWKNHDEKATADFLSDKYVGFSSTTGRQSKADNLKSFAAQKCDVKSYSFSDEQMTPIGNDVAVLTFKAAQDYTCDGKKGTPETWSASAYVRDGDKWKNVFYSEQPIVDAKAPTPKAKTGEAKATESAPDPSTDALMAVEKKAWDSWKARDIAGVESVMAKDFVSFGGMGRKDRAESIKGWSEPKCTGLGYAFAEPMGVQLAPDAALVTYKANSQGTCDGKPIAPTLWVASFDVKEGDAWKNAFYLDVPR